MMAVLAALRRYTENSKNAPYHFFPSWSRPFLSNSGFYFSRSRDHLLYCLCVWLFVFCSFLLSLYVCMYICVFKLCLSTLAVLGLHCWVWAFSSCTWRLLLVVVSRLLAAVAPLVAEQSPGAQASVVSAHRLSSCSSQALEHWLSSSGTQV